MSDPDSRRLSPARGLALAGLVAVAFALALEGIAHVLVGPAAPTAGETLPAVLRESLHSEYDPDLGWINQASVRVEDLYGPGTVYTTNSQRLRATREYTREVPAETFRIVCLGDSFTMGFGVTDEQTFPALLDARPGLEALNMGLGGFGIDQDYLWYLRDGVEFECDLLLFSMIPDDFRRMQTTLFQGTHPKPLLELYGERLEVRNVPVPPRLPEPAAPSALRAFANDLAVTRWLRARRTAHTGFSGERRAFEPLAEHLFRDLAATCERRDQGFALVFLPTPGMLQRGEPPLAAWLREFSARSGIAFFDLTPEFDPIPTDELASYYAQGHFSARGNALVAQALERFVNDRFRD